MASAIQKITLSTSRDIPFNKLLLSGCNVRRIKTGVSIEQLADDIARRTLLQSCEIASNHDPTPKAHNALIVQRKCAFAGVVIGREK